MFVSPHLPYRGSCPQGDVLAALRSLLNLLQPFQTPSPTFVIVHSDAGYRCEEAEEGEDQSEHNCHWGSTECVFPHRITVAVVRRGWRRACTGRGATLLEGGVGGGCEGTSRCSEMEIVAQRGSIGQARGEHADGPYLRLRAP